MSDARGRVPTYAIKNLIADPNTASNCFERVSPAVIRRDLRGP
jgi:hypothetical protein